MPDVTLDLPIQGEPDWDIKLNAAFTALRIALGSVPTTTDLANAVADQVTEGELATTLGPFITDIELATALAPYAKTGDASDAISKTLVNAKGDLLVGSADNTIVRLPAGANGQVLKANSAAAAGVEWGADATSSGGGGGAGVSRPSSAVVYSAGYALRPTADTANNIWVCDGTGDEVEINAAINAVAAAGGGKVQLIGPSFNVAGRIAVKTGVWVAGEGLGTQVRAVTDFQAGIFEFFDQTVHAAKISDFTLDGDNHSVHGLYMLLDAGQVFTGSPSTNPDSTNTVDNLNIVDMGNATFAGYGIANRGSNSRAGKFTNIRILGVSGCGVWIDCPDSHYENIEVGSSGKNGPAYSVSATAPVGHGWYVGGENNMIVNCKAWYSRGAGFYMHGTRNSFSNCQAQDNYSYGFDLYYGKNSFTSCQADSNGQGLGSATYGGGTAGFNCTSGSSTLVGCISFDRGQVDWKQQYGFRFTSGFNYSRVVGCLTYTNAASSVSGAAATTTTVDIQADVNGK